MKDGLISVLLLSLLWCFGTGGGGGGGGGALPMLPRGGSVGASSAVPPLALNEDFVVRVEATRSTEGC